MNKQAAFGYFSGVGGSDDFTVQDNHGSDRQFAVVQSDARHVQGLSHEMFMNI